MASAAEERTFHDTYDSVVQQADQGSAADRLSAAELLERRAGTGSPTLGTKRLLLPSAFDLTLRSDAPILKIEAIADQAIDVLRGDTLPLTTKRIQILQAANQRLGAQFQKYQTSAVADELFVLAELQFDDGKNKESMSSLQEGKKWAQGNPLYVTKMKSRIERFSAVLEQQIEIDDKLALQPNDPSANTGKGLRNYLKTPETADSL